MAIIGAFTKTKDGYSGVIEFLTCASAEVNILPAASKPNDQAPDFRVYRGVAEIGAAWAKVAKSGRRFLIVSLDDPGFAGPIQCRLVEAQKDFTLVWTR
jgi:uncharacterized protein (DUF736 family)